MDKKGQDFVWLFCMGLKTSIVLRDKIVEHVKEVSMYFKGHTLYSVCIVDNWKRLLAEK